MEKPVYSSTPGILRQPVSPEFGPIKKLAIWLAVFHMIILVSIVFVDSVFAAGAEIVKPGILPGSIPELSSNVGIGKQAQPNVIVPAAVATISSIDTGETITKTSLGASMFIGARVKDVRGNVLGEITELMINWTEGKLDYVVLQYGGVAGIGAKFVVVPTAMIKTARQGNTLILDITKEDLASFEKFDQDHPADYAKQATSEESRPDSQPPNLSDSSGYQ